jgi:hypothetical protein
MSPSSTKGTRDDFICLYASKETKKIDVKVSLTLPLTATSMSASSKTIQGAFPPSSKETYKIIIFVSIVIRRSQTEMKEHANLQNKTMFKKPNNYPLSENFRYTPSNQKRMQF